MTKEFRVVTNGNLFKVQRRIRVGLFVPRDIWADETTGDGEHHNDEPIYFKKLCLAVDYIARQTKTDGVWEEVKTPPDKSQREPSQLASK